jgi:hypothetical protein
VSPRSLLDEPASDSNMSTTRWLAKQHGVKSERKMYVAKPLPNIYLLLSKPVFPGISNTIFL